MSRDTCRIPKQVFYEMENKWKCFFSTRADVFKMCTKCENNHFGRHLTLPCETISHVRVIVTTRDMSIKAAFLNQFHIFWVLRLPRVADNTACSSPRHFVYFYQQLLIWKLNWQFVKFLKLLNVCNVASLHVSYLVCEVRRHVFILIP